MGIMVRDGWHITFLEHDLRATLPLKLRFADPDKIRQMQRRFGSVVAEDIAAMEYGIWQGRGGIWLTLHREQYQRLKSVNSGPHEG